MALPLGPARYSHSVQIRVGLVGILVCAALTSCNRAAPEPRPGRTLEPSITESSPMPTANPDNPACTLLSKKDRSDLVGYSMDAEVPVRPDPGTEECIWVHSLREPARAAVRVTALSTLTWARQVAPQIRAAIVKPTTGKALRVKLEAALADLIAGAEELPTEKACEAYLLLAESHGAVRTDQRVYYASIGGMPAAFGIACEDGIMTIVGYGEYGVGPSLALNRGVTNLATVASERAAEALGGADGDAEEGADAEERAADGDAGTDEDASPNPEPSPTETDEADSGDESES